MSLEIGQRVRLRVKKDALYFSEAEYNNRTGRIIQLTGNPYFPVQVSLDPVQEDGRRIAYFRVPEVEVIKDE